MVKLSFQTMWAHKRRLVGTVLAVVIGVGFLSGTLVLGDTLRDSFDKLFKAGYAGTDVVVRPERDAEPGSEAAGLSARTLPAALVDEIEALPGVRAASGDTLAFGRLIGADGAALGGNGPPTFAANWVDDDGLNPYRITEGRAPEAPTEVVIDDATAEDGELAVGDTTRILLPEVLEVTIVGLAQFGDGESMVGVTWAFFSPSGTAEHLTREPGTVHTISVAADNGVSQDELRDRIAPIVGDGNEAITGEAAADEAVDDINADFLGYLTTFLVVFAGIALFVATFSIYNTFSILVAQRTRESALMRAIGATRGQVMGSTMVEALVIGVVASALGLVAGIGVASGLKGMFAAFGLGLPAGGLTIKPSGIVISLVVGVVVTVVAALVPARRGSRIRPVEALRASAVETPVPRTVRTVLGAVLVVVGVAMAVGAVLGDSDSLLAIAGFGAVAILVGALVLGPVTSRPVARALGAPFAALGGVTGELARENAVRNPRRTASTSAALMIGVAIVVLFSVFVASLKALVRDSIGESFGGDLVVSESGGFGVPSLPPSLAADLTEIDGVEVAVGLGYGAFTIDGDENFFPAADVPTLGRVLDLGVVDGAVEDFEEGHIGISDDVAKAEELSLGDTLPVRFSDGFETDLEVSLIFSNAELVGSHLLSRDLWTAHTQGAADAAVFIGVTDDADLRQVRREAERLTEPLGDLSVEDREEYIDTVSGQLDQLLGIVIVMLGLAIVIAAMGIANTISLSVHERTRELGLLRAVGTTRPQVRRLVRWEAVIVSTFGTVSGVVLGAGLGWILTQVALSESGTASPFALPTTVLVVVLVAGVVVGVLASIRPARRAARLEVLSAIEEM